MHPTIKLLREKFNYSNDIVTRKINNISYIYLESVSSDDKISNFLNKGIINNLDDLYLEMSVYNSNIKIEESVDKCINYLTSGFTCVFITNSNKYLAIETKTKLDRGVSESTYEPVLRGPKDSFTENHSINIGLIRKRIKSNDLWFEELSIGEYTNTKVSIAYINNKVSKDTIKKVLNKIKKINIDGIIDSGYIKNYLEKDIHSIFPQILCTERPDLTCINLLKGKIAIIVENSPIVLILPVSLNDFFITSEDYYQNYKNAMICRIIRLTAFIISILTPAIYIALMTYNQEMIPNELFISLAAGRSQVPFPTFIEILIFIVVFSILREADIRSPSIAGSTMGIVGALALGEAAVSAGLISPMVIIVIAVTSISELVFNDIDICNSIRIWRILFILSTTLTGIIGIVSCLLIFIIKISSIEYLDTPYLSPFSPINNKIKDSIYIEPIYKRDDFK